MSHNKTYPNNKKLRRNTRLICHATEDLHRLGIEILMITFNKLNPVFQVAHCAANNKIKSHFTGQGINQNGERYHSKTAIFCGCEVKWQEVQNG